MAVRNSVSKKTSKVTSSGHKVGQMIGDFLEDILADPFVVFAKKHGYYCDRKGDRPKVRGKKISWNDTKGNTHNMDFVFEKNGSLDKQGVPIAFIEIAWRRYTKHSRNKAGELQASLPHLKEAYKDTCTFIGAVIAGSWTPGAINQMESNGIEIIYINYKDIFNCFKPYDIDLDYPENSSEEVKNELVKKIENLSPEDVTAIKSCIRNRINDELEIFINKLNSCIKRKPSSIRIISLFGKSLDFENAQNAINFIIGFSEEENSDNQFCKYEIYIKFENGDKLEGVFEEKCRAIEFLEGYI